MINPYVELLRAELPRVVSGEEINGLMRQSIYCGQALARIGADFRGLVMPIFAQHVCNLFERTVTEAMDLLCHQLDLFKWSEFRVLSATVHKMVVDDPDDSMPPRVLATFPMVAEWVNGCLRAMNELRVCAPRQLYKSLSIFLEQQTQRVTLFVQQQVNPTQTVNLTTVAAAAASMQEQELLAKQNHKEVVKCVQLGATYLQKCLNKIFNKL